MRNLAIALAALVATLTLAGPAQAHGDADGTTYSVQTLTTHCVATYQEGTYCRQREVMERNTPSGARGVWFRHRDFRTTRLGFADGYGHWSRWHFHRYAAA